MITLTFTDNEKAIINSGSSFKEIRLEFPDHEIEDIENNQVYLDAMSLEESIFEGDVLKFGECNGSLFKIRVADFDEDIQNARMNVYVHYTNENLGEVDVPFGKYIVSSVERTSDRRWRDITATDYMSKFDVDIVDWYNSTLYPTSETTRTVKEIRTMLCSYIGVTQATSNEYDESTYDGVINYRGHGIDFSFRPEEDFATYLNLDNGKISVFTRSGDSWNWQYNVYQLGFKDVSLINDDLIIGKTIETTSLKGRDLLKAICEINACFGHFDWNGVLKYITIEFDGLFPSDTLYPSNDLYPRAGTDSGVDTEYILRYKQDGCKYADYDVQDIDSVAIMKEDGALAVHAEIGQTYTNRYNIVGNFLLYGFSTAELEDIAETILSKIGDCSYRPNTTTIYGGVYMEMGQDYVVNATTYVGTEVIDKKFYTYLLKRTITGIQTMYSTLEAMGEQYQPEVPTYDVVSEIKALYGKSASYKRDLESLRSEYTDFATNTTSTIAQQAESIVLSVDDNGNVVAVELMADRETGTTNFTVGADNISLEGKTFDLTSDNIKIQSTNFNVDTSGNVLMSVETYYIDHYYAGDGRGTNPPVTSYDIEGIYTTFPIPSADNVNKHIIYLQNSGASAGPVYYCRSITGGYSWARETFDGGYVTAVLGKASFSIDAVNGITLKSKQFEIDEYGNVTIAGALWSSAINVNNKFQVDEQGNATASSLAITGGSINIADKFEVDNQGNLNINDKLTIDNQGNLNINDVFVVDKNGNATAESLTVENGTITGSTINGGTINGTDITGVDVQTETLTIKDQFNVYYNVSEEGYVYQEKSATFTGYNTAGDEDKTALRLDLGEAYDGDGVFIIVGNRTVFNCDVIIPQGYYFTNNSDRRLKENIESINEAYEKAYYKISPKLFNFIGFKEHEIGFIAQELEETLLECGIEENNSFIHKTPDDKLGEVYSIDYTKFIAYNMHMIQKQHKEINDLKDELATLKEQVAFLVERSK